jgi:hypothetical protein
MQCVCTSITRVITECAICRLPRMVLRIYPINFKKVPFRVNTYSLPPAPLDWNH